MTLIGHGPPAPSQQKTGSVLAVWEVRVVRGLNVYGLDTPFDPELLLTFSAGMADNLSRIT